jgi:TolA-binding protein
VGWADKAKFQIGSAYVRMGRHAEAAEEFQSLKDGYPNSPLVSEASLQRAKALLALGRRDEAEAALRPLSADASQLIAAQAALELGGSQLERGRAAEARATFEAAIKRFPGSQLAPALSFRAAEAAQKEGRTELARAAFAKMADAAPDHPWAAEALLRAASIALDARDYAAAQSLASAVSTRYPASPLLSDTRLIEARAATALGAPKRAIRLINALLADAKTSAETAQAARFYLGQAYRADGQPDKANEVLESLSKTPASPVATDAQFLLGEEHFKAGRYAEAINLLEKYLAGKPRGDVAEYALAYLAAAYLAKGQTATALTTLDKLTEQFPKSTTLDPIRLRVAEACVADKGYDRAAELYKQVAEGGDAKWKVRSLSGLGWSLLQGGKPADAAQAFRARLELDAKDSLAAADTFALGRALEECEHPDEALAAFTTTLERYSKNEYATAALLARARLYAKQKQPAEAARDFAAYLANPPAKAEGLDLVLADLGWALLDANKTAEADKAFRQLLDQFPESTRAPDARLNLAESAYQQKKYDDVVLLLEPIAAAGANVEPMVAQSALFRLGRTAIARKDWDAAARWFGRLTADYDGGPFQLEARFWKAEAAFQAGNAKSAETEFAALAASKSTPESEGWIRTARLRWIQSLNLLEQWKEAFEQAGALRAEVPNHPQMSEIDYARGRALQGLARFDEARIAYQAVIDARKGGDLAARAQFMRGETYFHQKNYSEALREFLKVDLLFNAPQWQAAALLEVGKVYERLAQWTEAAEIYKKLLDKFPKDPSAAESARRLDQVRLKAAGAKERSDQVTQGAP